MKKKEYVAGVVEIYRKYIDNNYAEVSENDYNNLLELFNRNGFSESYYEMHNSSEMISLKAPSFRTQNRDYIERLNKTYSDKILKHKINLKVICKANRPFKIVLNDDSIACEYEEQVPEIANNQPLSKETIDKQLRKTNNTDFVVGDIVYDIDNNLYMNIKDLNQARRDFIDLLYDKLLQNNRNKPTLVFQKETPVLHNEKLQINVLVSNARQLEAVLSNNTLINRVYIDLNGYNCSDVTEALERLSEEGVDAYIALPQVARANDIRIIQKQYLDYIKGCDGVLIRNIEHYFLIKEMMDCGDVDNLDIVLDYNLNITNQVAAQYYKELGSLTANVELNSRELQNIGFDEIIVYGKLPVMTSANCALKTMNYCNKKSDKYYDECEELWTNEFKRITDSEIYAALSGVLHRQELLPEHP